VNLLEKPEWAHVRPMTLRTADELLGTTGVESPQVGLAILPMQPCYPPVITRGDTAK
jgi:hypothetical protein